MVQFLPSSERLIENKGWSTAPSFPCVLSWGLSNPIQFQINLKQHLLTSTGSIIKKLQMWTLLLTAVDINSNVPTLACFKCKARRHENKCFHYRASTSFKPNRGLTQMPLSLNCLNDRVRTTRVAQYFWHLGTFPLRRSQVGNPSPLHNPQTLRTPSATWWSPHPSKSQPSSEKKETSMNRLCPTSAIPEIENYHVPLSSTCSYPVSRKKKEDQQLLPP